MAQANSDELESQARETADGGAARRLWAEAQTRREIEVAEDVARALEVLEAAAAQTSRRTLGVLAQRLGRAYSRAMARLGTVEREAVRTALRGGGE